MNMRRILLSSVPIVLLAGILTPQFAQETDQQANHHAMMVGFVRTVNTAEAINHASHASYAAWQELLASQDEKLNIWLKQIYMPQAGDAQFGKPPEVLPGMKLRLMVPPDGHGYLLFLEDATDKTGFAVVSDERGIIRVCKWLGN